MITIFKCLFYYYVGIIVLRCSSKINSTKKKKKKKKKKEKKVHRKIQVDDKSWETHTHTHTIYYLFIICNFPFFYRIMIWKISRNDFWRQYGKVQKKYVEWRKKKMQVDLVCILSMQKIFVRNDFFFYRLEFVYIKISGLK